MKLIPVVISSIVGCLAVGAAFGQAVPPSTNTAPPPKNPWDASAAAGLTLTRGNSKTLLFSASIEAAKKWDQNEISLGADGVYGENNSVRNEESIHGFAQYNRLLTDRLYAYLRFDGLHDAIADVDYRLTLSPGMGYYIVKETNTTFRAEAGPGYIYEHDNHGGTHSYMILRLAERFDHKLNDHAKIWESVEILPQVDKFSNYIMNAELGVETAMTTRLALQTLLQDTYHSEPSPGRMKNDVKLIAAVKYKF